MGAEFGASPAPSSPRLTRQRSFAAAFSSLCGLCGKHGLCDLDLDAFFSRFPPSHTDKPSEEKQQQQQEEELHPPQPWWHDSWRLLASRRRSPSTASAPIFVTRSGTATSAWSEEDLGQLYGKPSRWKLFCRRLRAETRKMNCSRPAPPGFHYDALSYALNFDDGNNHVRFAGLIAADSSSFKTSTPAVS